VPASRRWALAALAIAGLLFLPGCGGGPVSMQPSARTSVSASARPVSMQLHARTAVGTGAQAQAWATAILRALKAPAKPVNTASMIAWFAAEDDGHAAGVFTYGAGANNPLNLTVYSGETAGMTGTEPSGAGPDHPGNIDFDTPAHGVTATVRVIRDKYPVIAHALRSGRGLLSNPAVAAELSTWSGDGYSSLR